MFCLPINNHQPPAQTAAVMLLQPLGVVALLPLLGLAAAHQAPSPPPSPVYSPDFSYFPLQQNAGTTGLFPMPPCGGFHLEEASIDDMQQAMANGDLTAVQLTLCYLERIYQTQDYLK